MPRRPDPCQPAIFPIRADTSADTKRRSTEDSPPPADGDPRVRLLGVIPLAPLKAPLTYSLPAHLPQADQVKWGSLVMVPLRGRCVPAVVWQEGEALRAGVRIKPVQSVIEGISLSSALRSYLSRMARYTVQDLGSIMGLALPLIHQARPKTTRTSKRPSRDSLEPSSEQSLTRKLDLSPAQFQASQALQKMCHVAIAPEDHPQTQDHWCPVVLFGPTGSGKTEVVVDLARARLRASPEAQILFLVPQIALIESLRKRLQGYGLDSMAWHSGLGVRLRRTTFDAIVSGGVRIIVGPRSAIHLPYRNLSLTVVDEEHDANYKQEDAIPRYHGRDMAILRAREEQSAVVLLSATPSLETMLNVQRQRYGLVRLPVRFRRTQAPVVHVLDVGHRARPDRQKPVSGCPPTPLPTPRPAASTIFHPEAVAAVSETIRQGHQVLIYHNRRGFAPVLTCRSCGVTVGCPHCSVPLSVHLCLNDDGSTTPIATMLCHYCAFSAPEPDACPSCQSRQQFERQGWGIERVAKETERLFPDATIDVAVSDRLRTLTQLNRFHERIHSGTTDIIVGTQVMAKGHHLRDLTTVVVVDADLGLASGDYRASETVYQTLTQLVGRVGRERDGSRVLFQTRQPCGSLAQVLPFVHEVGSYERFVHKELPLRQSLRAPPYNRSALIHVRGKTVEAAIHGCQALRSQMPDPPGGLIVFPAVCAPIRRIRQRYRYRYLIKASRGVDLSKWVGIWLGGLPKLPGGATVDVDIDPISFS